MKKEITKWFIYSVLLGIIMIPIFIKYNFKVFESMSISLVFGFFAGIINSLKK